jgi:hypothetical protein
MSGWIKLEKDRRDDPRVIRMARELRHAGVTHERFTSAMHVTLVLGCLDVLWCYADTHVRDDDTLDLGADEIDELVGLQGFCNLVPSDWLEVLDANRVKLPDFHAHNGTESKKKALNQKRQERKRNADALQVVTQTSRTSVTPALPDQDQTKTYTKTKEEKNEMSAEPTAVEFVFSHWQSVWGHATSKLDDKRRKIIRQALQNYSEADLCQCISGYQNSPHHTGTNDRATVYDSIELFLRDAKHIDAGLKFYREPPRSDLSEATRRTIAQTEDWQPPETRRAAN